MKKTWILALGLAAIALTGCGGGGGDDDQPPVTAAVPPGATTSSDNFVTYLKALVAASADTLEPVDASAVTPPTADSGEPAPID
ncbi:MAG TPA: hypothetical protein VNU71_18085 [Burkholderiaceae bacterium]|nr:hypothetical protein [Burkholderiaceae bacterium]